MVNNLVGLLILVFGKQMRFRMIAIILGRMFFMIVFAMLSLFSSTAYADSVYWCQPSSVSLKFDTAFYEKPVSLYIEFDNRCTLRDSEIYNDRTLEIKRMEVSYSGKLVEIPNKCYGRYEIAIDTIKIANQETAKGIGIIALLQKDGRRKTLSVNIAFSEESYRLGCDESEY